MKTFVTDSVSASIAAQNTYSDPIWMDSIGGLLMLSGTWSATVTLQVASNGNANTAATALTWVDSDSLTANGVWSITVKAPSWVRFGVATGNYSSGTVVGVIRR